MKRTSDGLTEKEEERKTTKKFSKRESHFLIYEIKILKGQMLGFKFFIFLQNRGTKKKRK